MPNVRRQRRRGRGPHRDGGVLPLLLLEQSLGRAETTGIESHPRRARISLCRLTRIFQGHGTIQPAEPVITTPWKLPQCRRCCSTVPSARDGWNTSPAPPTASICIAAPTTVSGSSDPAACIDPPEKTTRRPNHSSAPRALDGLYRTTLLRSRRDSPLPLPPLARRGASDGCDRSCSACSKTMSAEKVIVAQAAMLQFSCKQKRPDRVTGPLTY